MHLDSIHLLSVEPQGRAFDLTLNIVHYAMQVHTDYNTVIPLFYPLIVICKVLPFQGVAMLSSWAAAKMSLVRWRCQL